MGITRSGATLLGLLALAVCAHGQDYPAKPVRIIVPLAPGGLGDQLTRVVATKLGPATKQPAIVENRTGGGIIGAEAAAKAAPDGYTLVAGLHNTQAILPHRYARLPYMMMFDIAPFALPNMRAGKVRALAVTTPARLPVAPQLPTMAEAGMPEVQGGAWFALFAPAGTPRSAIDWWNREARRVFSEPETRERFESQGAVLPGGTPEALAAFVAADSQRWGRVIRAAGIKID